LKTGLDQATANAVDFYYNGLGNNNSRYNIWKEVKDKNKTTLTDFRASTTGLQYDKYTPSFGTNQKRIVTFITDLTASTTVKNTLQNIYSNKNDNAQTNPYNFKRRFN
jgi:CO dehydrogenase/acetyl-CoA synthase beta subunit